ncbi:MAG: hypothetical protein Q8R17_02065 [bacterium]|nr:hypothetical protein [bacterium]
MAEKRYQTLLAEVLETIKREKGEEEMKKMFRECKEAGKEAMSRQVLSQISKQASTELRQLLLARHPDLKNI